MEPLVFFVNGRKVVEENPEPELTLAWYLREKLGLTGTKLGCEEGQCGSCTVVVGSLTHGKHPKFRAVNACLLCLGLVHGCAVITVEGIGSVRKGMHPIQDELAKGHGSQCGFCTPGFVMSMYALLRNNPQPLKTEIEAALQGNLCRCTGYRPILESFGAFSPDQGCGKENCCRFQGRLRNEETVPSLPLAYDPTQEPIFPPELLLSNYSTQSISFSGKRILLFLPTTLEEFFKVRLEHPKAKLLASGSIVGLMERNGTATERSVWISITRIGELKTFHIEKNELVVGAGYSIAELDEFLMKAEKELPAEKCGIISGLRGSISLLYSVQLRNLASWSGNLASGSPISDLNVPLLASGSSLMVQSADSSPRRVEINQEFFKESGWPKINLLPGEVITGLVVPFTSERDFFLTMKQGMRKGSDSAVVNAAFLFRFVAGTDQIQEARLSFGGMSSRPLLAFQTQQLLIGTSLTKDTLDQAIKCLSKEIHVGKGSFGGKEAYRNALCLSFLFKGFLAAEKWLQSRGIAVDLGCPDREKALGLDNMGPVHGKQEFPGAPKDQECADPIGRPVQHVYGNRHATGEADYTGDIPADKLCHLGMVLSSRSHAKILSVDTSAALALPGVLAYVDRSDIPSGGSNKPLSQPQLEDDPEAEHVFAVNEVTAVGDCIGAIVAENVDIARRAAKLVKVDYEDLPSIFTVEEAIAKQSFYGTEPIVVRKGKDVEEALAECKFRCEGEVSIGGQEHAYLETQCALAKPGEEDHWEVYVSTQDPKLVQKAIGGLMGVPLNRVVTKTVRVGGAFGGKISQSVYSALPAVVAAEKVRRPVRCVFSRSEDMIRTGKRHPGTMKYRAGFDENGDLQAFDAEIYLNAGHTQDESILVLMVCLNHFALSYHIPHVLLRGRVCKTNLPSNTAFRAFGNPQGIYFIERVLDQIAQKLNIPTEQVRELNLSKPGELTCNKNVISEDDRIRQCWDYCKDVARFEHGKMAVQDFNENNRWRKRGLAMTPVRWGIGMAGSSFEQGAVLMNVYMDGSIIVSHGGIEMGQGLNTKVLQCASRALNLPIENFTILDNASDKVPNPPTCGGSQGSDVHGLAAKEAAEILLQRLAPYRERNPKGKWADWVNAANEDRVSLSVTAIGRPEIPPGNAPYSFRYCVTGAACVEAEIDCLTGEHQLLRTEIVMDLGCSMNPGIDIGQIEGAFIQGYGLYTVEDLDYSLKNGQLISNSLGKYKIPNVATVPRIFNVHLIDGKDKFNVYSSKGVGEPPLLLGVGSYFAILEAVRAARSESENTTPFELPAPATAEKIRLACGDRFLSMASD